MVYYCGRLLSEDALLGIWIKHMKCSTNAILLGWHSVFVALPLYYKTYSRRNAVSASAAMVLTFS